MILSITYTFPLFEKTMKNNQEIAKEVISGLWGNGEERKNRLTAAGYNYLSIQSIVNALMSSGVQPAEPAEQYKQPEIHYLSIDFDTSKYNGLEINLIIGE